MELERQGDMELYAGDCPLEDTGAVLDAEQHYTCLLYTSSKTAIEFFQNAQSVDFFSALEIPKEFQDIAVEFYDLILENDHPTALLGCRGNYDIAVQIDEVTGTMTGWHWFK